MFKLTQIAFAACAMAAISSSTAFAADLPDIPEPVPVPLPAVGGWYLRGDIGISNQRVDELDNVLYEAFASVDTEEKDFDAALTIGLGVGYRFNQWFRADITGEYRADSEFNGRDVATGPEDPDIPDPFTDDYTAEKQEWLALANVYADLGSYHGITPFVGAGIGATRTTISDFVDIGGAPDAGGEADDESTWDLAWALYAGIAYQFTPAFTMELAYRYLHLGDAESGDIVQFDGTNLVDNPMEFHDLSSHDVKIGFRYQFN